MKFRRYLPLAAAALGLLGSFFLPSAVAGVMDARRLDNLIIIDAQSISFDAIPELSLPERIALVSSPNTEILPLATGQVMEKETAEVRAVRELARFFRGGSFEFAADESRVEAGSAAFVIDSEDPSANMIIWEFKILDRHTNEATVTIDDETGMILKLIYQQDSESTEPKMINNDDVNGSGDNMHRAVLQLSVMLTEYYGHPVDIGDYQHSVNLAYYRADLYGGGSVVLMYGVVRAAGFTMNERL